MEGILNNIAQVFGNLPSIAALVGLVAIVIVLICVRKVKLDTRTITSIGVAIALAAILHAIKLYHLPQGGSVTPGSMVPILLMAFFYGPEVGFLTGFLFGFVSLIIDPYILHPVQVLFDYPLPFMMLGLAGYFRSTKTWIMSGTVIAILARFACHVISGIVFFASSAPEGTSPLLYSIIYNGSYLGLDAVICLVIIGALPIKRLYAIMNKQAHV